VLEDDSKVAARIPVQDCGDGEFALFESADASGDHTQMAWEVEDIEATVERLRARGVVFEEYDLPGLRTVNGIAEVAGNYPSKGGVGEKAAWFRDGEGNLFGIGQPMS
jgi:catechol 2,3-dioxygenase-like lactoylglutathione lyase family enzyme